MRGSIANRIGALLFAVGAALTALATVLPHSAKAELPVFWLAAGAQAAAAVILLALPQRVQRRRWIRWAIAGLAVAAVWACVFANGERLGGPPALNEFFWVWPAFYIGYFLRPAEIVLLVGLIAASYAWLLSEIGIPTDEAATRWIVTVSVVAGSALALHLLRRNIDGLLARLRDTARTDALTGLLNRRGFDERFALELERARRTDMPVALVLGDVDRFKALNDRFGHGAGDTALVCVGEALASGSRVIDSVARIGGEEFALLLPGTDAAGAGDAAERLRGAIGEIRDGGGTPITISFGVAVFPTHGTDAEALMPAADDALYRAKAQGRDQTVVTV